MLPLEAAVEPDLRNYLRVLRRRKAVVALSVAVVLGVSLMLSYLQTPLYAATAKLLLRPRSTQSIFATNSPTNVDPARSVHTEIEVIKTEPVRNLVRDKIGSAPPIDVSPVGQTDLVTIRAQSTDANRSAAVANAYASAYVDFRRKQAVDDLSAAGEELQTKVTDIQQQIDNLGSALATAPTCADSKTTPEACTQRTTAEQTIAQRRTTLLGQLGLFQQRLDQLQVDAALASGGADLVTPASTPSSPFQPAPRRNAVLGIVLGSLFGIGLALLVDYMDDSIRGKDDFERAVPGMAVLGIVPLVADWKEKDRCRLISMTDPTSSAAEAYRILRTSIQFLGLDRPVRVLQVTSPNAQDGKTTTLANLAVAFAASGLRTVAVDCDLRRPRLHEFFGLANDVGFTSVLLGNVALARALQPVSGQERLLIFASGPLPPNPSELLSSNRTAELLQNLAEQADIVLIDSPPALPVTDALVLSQRVDSTVIVTTAGTTTQKAAARAVEMLQQVKAPLVGAVLNGVPEDSAYANYSYRYYAPSAERTDNASKLDGEPESSDPRRQRRRPAKRSA